MPCSTPVDYHDRHQSQHLQSISGHRQKRRPLCQMKTFISSLMAVHFSTSCRGRGAQLTTSWLRCMQNLLHESTRTATIVFDGYSTQQTTKAATRIRRHGTSVQVNFTGDMILQDTREKFLANPSNKQRFINLLNETLMKLGFKIHHAKDDADCLIVKTTLDVAASSTTVLIGEDTDLLVLLLYHVTDNLHGVYFMPSGRKDKLWDIKTARAKIGTETCKRLLFCTRDQWLRHYQQDGEHWQISACETPEEINTVSEDC